MKCSRIKRGVLCKIGSFRLRKKIFSFVIVFTLIVNYGITFAAGASFPLQKVIQEENEQINTEQFQLDQGTSRFYVAVLSQGDVWNINCTAYYKGIFYLFIFSERPREKTLLDNGSLNPEHLQRAIAYNITPSEKFSETLNDTVCYVSLNITARREQLYYLEVALVEGGPDTYLIESNVLMQPYFILFINGYPSLVTILITTFTAIILSLKLKRRLKNKKRYR